MWHTVCIQFSLLFLRNMYFTELQNKTLEGKKSLTSKRDNAKYDFT